MPRGDGTGPIGSGPMSGRAAGICAGNYAPGYANRNPRYCGPRGGGAWGRGGQGRGAMGWGAQAGFGPGPGWPVSDERALKLEAIELKRCLAAVEARLGRLADAAKDDDDGGNDGP